MSGMPHLVYQHLSINLIITLPDTCFPTAAPILFHSLWWAEKTEFIQNWRGFFPPSCPHSPKQFSLCSSLPQNLLSLCTSYNYLKVSHILQARHMTLRCYSEEHHGGTYRNRNTRGLPAAVEHLATHDTQLAHYTSLETSKNLKFFRSPKLVLSLVNFLSKLSLIKISQPHLKLWHS